MAAITPLASFKAPQLTPALKAPQAAAGGPDDAKLRKTFDAFVGETFFGQMLSSMRKTVGEPAYFHGGRAEEVFQGQLDQVLSQHMAQASAAEFSGPMYELFNLNRK